MESILKNAILKKQKALSEYDAKLVINEAGVPITREVLTQTEEEAVAAAAELGYPVVLKGCDHNLMHKTETGMVHLNITNDEALRRAYREITGAGIILQGVLVQEMIHGNREFVVGLTQDNSFGPCVMFGLGGIFTEAMKDVTFRVAPFTREDAAEMLTELQSGQLLDEFREVPRWTGNFSSIHLWGFQTLQSIIRKLRRLISIP